MEPIEQESPVAGTVSPSTSPQIIEVKSVGNGRTALWILLSVVIGFMLPVCSCALFFAASIIGLSAIDSGSVASTGSGDAVAIVRVEGTMFSSDDPDLPGAFSGRIMADLRAAAADPTVKAIVLRIDSPGGTVTSAAQIREAMLEIEKPIVVSMSSVAASGGYYISAPADYIFARPDTVTGSLGVVLTLYDATELIDEIGVDVIAITSGPNKAIGSPWEEMTEEHMAIFEASIEESYAEFVRVIVEGRHMDEETVRQLADGRIYTGRQALDNGLIDELGNYQDAIDKAAALGGISGEPRIIEYERLPSFEQLLTGFSTRLTRTEADELLTIISEMSTPSLEYRYVPTP